MTDRSGQGDPIRTLRLLWRHHLPAPVTRGPAPSRTVDEVVAAAIELADRDGLDSVSMRKVAAQVGLTPMALYGYVADKAELLDVMVDTVYRELPRRTGRRAWRRRVEQLVSDNLALHERHPWLIDVSTTRPPLGPNVIAKYDAELRAFDGAGLDDVERDAALTLVLDFVHGIARGARAAALTEQVSALSEQQWWAASADLLGQVVDSRRWSMAVRVGAAAGEAHGAAYSADAQLRFGLAVLLDGIAARGG